MEDFDIDARIEEVNNEMVTQVEEEVDIKETPPSQPIDTFQQQRDQWHSAERRESRGAKPRMKLDLSIIDTGTLKRAHKKAKSDSEYYTKIGNRQYASMVKQQYMNDMFLPAVDALVKLNGMGAVQANQDILRQLDALTLLDGTRGAGYTQAFIRSMYRPELNAMGIVERSDRQVEQAVRSIKQLCEDDQIRSAVGRANDLKRRIDAGENIASGEDYELIERVALYGQ